MKVFTLLPILLLLGTSILAQTPPVLCGHELVLSHWEKTFPAVRQAVDKTFSAAQRRSQEASPRSNDIYTIPVVVHVVWKDSVENLPDSLILAQMRVLNEDYRRLNLDAANVRNVFMPVVGDAQIEFELLAVERVQTDAEFALQLDGGLPDAVKQTSQGGSDAWDTETHLNIWVCKLQPLTIGNLTLAQILGYAYPPAGLSNWPDGVSAPSPELDGVVIDYRAFGPDNPHLLEIPGLNTPLRTKGRTTVHEVGHYLGLRHIWGDGGGILGGDSCGEDDGIFDTPNTSSQSNFDCDTTRNTCIDATDDRPDMIENFMDYAAEDCMNSFTVGQIDIMRSVLEDERCGLVGNCLQTSTRSLSVSKDDLTVYPNPANQQLHVRWSGPAASEYLIHVYDLLGRTVRLEKNKGNRIDVSGMDPGTYLLEISQKGQRRIKRIVIHR